MARRVIRGFIWLAKDEKFRKEHLVDYGPKDETYTTIRRLLGRLGWISQEIEYYEED